MTKVKQEAFKVIGIKVRTTNENGQAASDIGQLWNQFVSEKIQQKIPNKIDSSVLSIYTNYDSDHTKPYDTLLGCRVSTLDGIPEGMIGQQFEAAIYECFTAKGDLSKGVVYNAWLDIWEKPLDRTYLADFEEYNEKASDRTNAEVDIFVSING